MLRMLQEPFQQNTSDINLLDRYRFQDPDVQRTFSLNPCGIYHNRELTPPKLRNTFEKNFRNDLLKTLQLLYFHMVQ